MVALHSDWVLIILNSALKPCLCRRQALLRRIIHQVYPVIAPNVSAVMHDPSINYI